MRSQRRLSRIAVTLALVLVLATLVAACGADSATSPNKPTARGTPVNGAYQLLSPDPVYSAAITFDASVTYDTALRELADLGLQPVRICVWKYWAWQSPGYKANWGSGAGTNEFVVAATPLSPLGWMQPLGKLPGVRNVEPNPIASCPAMGFTPPPADTPTYLPPEDAGTVARIHFGVATPYATALDTITELGFRLGDPCYERQPQGASVAWHSMGQEQSYAATHALIVVTTPQNSTQWERQAQANAGVAGVDVSPALSC